MPSTVRVPGVDVCTPPVSSIEAKHVDLASCGLLLLSLFASLQVLKAVFEQKGQSFDNSKRLRVNDARVKVNFFTSVLAEISTPTLALAESLSYSAFGFLFQILNVACSPDQRGRAVNDSARFQFFFFFFLSLLLFFFLFCFCFLHHPLLLSPYSLPAVNQIRGDMAGAPHPSSLRTERVLICLAGLSNPAFYFLFDSRPAWHRKRLIGRVVPSVNRLAGFLSR